MWSRTSADTLCTPVICGQDNDKYKLECTECTECKRLVHYRCAQLPFYQIQLFLTKCYHKFLCLNCVEVPNYLLDIVPEVKTYEDSSNYEKQQNEMRDRRDEMRDRRDEMRDRRDEI